jgi:urease accessory protein
MRTVRSLSKANAEPADGRLILDYDSRQKSRFRARLESGEELAVHLPRGTVLADGDRLLTEDGMSIDVLAADEELSVATTDDALLLARAAYHLGNRHVPLRIGVGILAYRHDHVLDGMMRRLGLMLAFRRAPFTPEPGVYGHDASGGHRHGHDHGHAHDDAHARDHTHAHDHTHDQTHADDRAHPDEKGRG